MFVFYILAVAVIYCLEMYVIRVGLFCRNVFITNVNNTFMEELIYAFNIISWSYIAQIYSRQDTKQYHNLSSYFKLCKCYKIIWELRKMIRLKSCSSGNIFQVIEMSTGKYFLIIEKILDGFILKTLSFSASIS